MPQGLPRKIRLAFIVQAFLASLVLVVGFSVAAVGVRQVLLRGRLQDEASAAWRQLLEDPAAPLPSSSRLRAFYIPAGHRDTALPPALRQLPPGTHVPLWSPSVAIVDARPAGRLIIEVQAGLADDAVFWTAVLSLLLALGVTYLAAWLTYRISMRLVVPVTWLADVVAHWDPRSPTAAALAPPNLPIDSGSEVRRLAHALRGLAVRVGAYIERERHFTRDASHELRTPLTVIRVASDMMAADHELPARSQRAVARIQRAGHDMQAVIDAFFILARDAEVEAEAERFDVHEIVEEEMAAVRPLIGDRPLELVLTDHGGAVVDAPRRVLGLMVGNLLSNAVRFTERGRVEVVLRPGCIEVHDTGVGMAPETVEKAFDAFYREDRDAGEGMGIGLSVVRRLGERFDWPVHLASTPGQGTVATIQLQH